MPDLHRKCNICGIDKPLTADFFGHTSTGVFRHQCRLCKNARERKYDCANPHLVREKWQRQNLKRSLAGSPWCEADVVKIRSYVKDMCVYCSKKLERGGEIDHVISLHSGGTNALSNLTLACMPCNRAKGARNAEEFLLYRALHGLPVRGNSNLLLLNWKKQTESVP
jgi:5-methylcytosine-specific restriction endonuclease McrA